MYMNFCFCVVNAYKPVLVIGFVQYTNLEYNADCQGHLLD